MRMLNNSLLLFLALCLGTAPATYAQISPGSCTLGTAAKDLDVNQIRARVFNTGSLFYSETAQAQYIAPQSSGLSPIFASGIWIGGLVNGNLRTAGSRYAQFEFWPGPLNDDGSLPNPADCSAFDRIYKVSRQDIQDYEAGVSLDQLPDLRDWPAELGAPVLAAPDNGVDDDGDGLIDEGTDGLDNDGDGAIDERDEQERRIDGGYDLAAGDRPDIIGDQSLWWVMNDVGSSHDQTDTPPIGVEVRVQAFAFDRDNALGTTTFYKYTIEYKGSQPLEEAYLSVFSDPDLGDAGDDYIGSDIDLSLGYVYNGGRTDEMYGIPPAAGYDFFQGPVVDDQDGDGIRDTLGLTSFTYFINGGPPGTGDPTTGQEYYNYQKGLWGNGTEITAFGLGYQTPGEVTKFAFPGDPVRGEFWSEVNSDNSGGPNPASDRRLIVTTGPFTIEPGDVQDIVFGIVFAQGGSNLGSVSALRAADITAQAAYDLDFEVPEPPPAPRLCSRTNPDLAPGSGNCLEAGEVDDSAVIVWGYPESSSNYLGQFRKLGYSFEGFNIYQYPTSGFDQTQRRLVATYDKINGITRVNNITFDLDLDADRETVAARGSDSGLQYFYVPQSDAFSGSPLVNYTDYYFGVSAYGVNREAPRDRVVESSPTQITFRPSRVTAVQGGSEQQSDIGQVILSDRTGGGGIGVASAVVVDPTRVTGATYGVEIIDVNVARAPDNIGSPRDTTLITYRVTRDGQEIFNGANLLRDNGVYVPPTAITSVEDAEAIQDSTQGVSVFTGQYVIDGIQFININSATLRPEDQGGAPDFAGHGDGNNAAGIVETTNPNGEVCGPAAALADPGCMFYGGNTVWLDPNSTGDYVVTNPANALGALGNLPAAAPDDFEMRFTQGCASTGACLGVYADAAPGTAADELASVPFELWNIGRTPDDSSDDIRMIPILRTPDGAEPVQDWANALSATQDVIVGEDTLTLGVTHPLLWMMPDRPDGYALFKAAADGFGGPGGTYDPQNDGDTQVDSTVSSSGAVIACQTQRYYIDFCYKKLSPRFVVPIGGLAGMEIADLAGDGTTPAAGTTIRFRTVPKGFVAGDQFSFDTSSLALLTDASFNEEALDMIGIVPNPYRGRSAYETGNADRRVRFTNLPPQVTVRIYTVSGTLIKTLNKSDESRSLDWDLTTTNNLPVASGMYIIHVQARNSDSSQIGERVLKFGVINRQIDVDVF